MDEKKHTLETYGQEDTAMVQVELLLMVWIKTAVEDMEGNG